ncbi:MAG: CpsD/CapB family tyrosine-protein kinase [Clostridia bacterium]|nr:CpsD/CapB family tyrosine-protein kinase [Clostridia bacterium]
MSIDNNNKKKKKYLNEYNADMLLSSKTSFNVAEAYKTLRTNLMFSVAAIEDVDFRNVYVISSSLPGEGKSITSANLAIALSQTGSRVLLIDADLRKPVQNKLFAASNVRGLSTVLINENTVEESVKKDVRPNLDLLTSGKIPSNPSELLGSKAMRDLLAQLSKVYDYIVLDTPPLNIVSDALTFAAHTAGILLAICPSICKHDQLKKSVESIKLAKVNILGAFFSNTMNKSFGSYYKRRYGRYGRYYYRKYGY